MRICRDNLIVEEPRVVDPITYRKMVQTKYKPSVSVKRCAALEDRGVEGAEQTMRDEGKQEEANGLT